MEKIRVSLNSAQRSKLVYTHKLYSFQTENAAIEPVRIQEICEQGDGSSQDGYDAAGDLGLAATVNNQNDNDQSELLFNHEWAHQKVIIACNS